MPEQQPYPHFVFDPRTGTHLRYNSPVSVFLAGEAQLQVQHLNEPRLLHSDEAVPCSKQDFQAAADAAYVRVVLEPQQRATDSTVQYQQRRQQPDAWYYQVLGPGIERRLNLYEYEGRPLCVNLMVEDMSAGPWLIIRAERSSDPRRVSIEAADFQAALQRGVKALAAATQGKAAV